MAEVNARLSAFKGDSPEALSQERNRAASKVDYAHREAGYNIMEASAKLDIRKLDFDPTLSAEAKGKLVLDLSVKLENIHASRRLWKIFDELSHGVEELENITRATGTINDLLTAKAGEIAALKTRIGELSARIAPKMTRTILNLKTELQFLVEVMTNGKWKQVAAADKEDKLRLELDLLVRSELYDGATTGAAARKRISEIELELENFYKAQNNQLQEEEIHELQASKLRISEMETELLEVEAANVRNLASLQAARQKYIPQFEAALVSAKCIAEVYQINCERLALGLRRPPIFGQRIAKLSYGGWGRGRYSSAWVRSQ